MLIQVGPGKEFEPLVRERYPDKKFVTLSQKSDIEALKEIFPEVELDLGLQTVSEPEE